ncbi:hypothetical protein B0H17DRAFT_1097339 [Mycena rosella]|uniref:Uncharacterized protein n=1 Tax=Mycena rosella TaxID=1033263 RepID=A0AAD7CR60_MYCRO|nr:hypothetical protein B0H17DRAFT_1097339 [Mycena rosella]
MAPGAGIMPKACPVSSGRRLATLTFSKTGIHPTITPLTTRSRYQRLPCQILTAADRFIWCPPRFRSAHSNPRPHKNPLSSLVFLGPRTTPV